MACNLNDKSGGNRSSAHLWRQAQRPNSIPAVAQDVLLFISFMILLHSIYPTLIPRSPFHGNSLRDFFSTSLLLAGSHISPLASLDNFFALLALSATYPFALLGPALRMLLQINIFFPELHTFACIDIINIHKS